MSKEPAPIAVQRLSRDDARRLADRCARLLVEKYGARRAFPFGSAAGDSPWHSRSDIDVAVEGLPESLHTKAWAELTQLMPPGIELDLVEIESLRPAVKARALGDIEMPGDYLAALRLEVEDEFKNAARAAGQLTAYLASAPVEPDVIVIAGLAMYLHDFYQGAERIFERIAVRLDGGLPTGQDWHTALLLSMMRPVVGVRPAVVDQILHDRLLEFLKFRHRIRHTYSFDLDWEKMKPRATELPEVVDQLRTAINEFLEKLGQRTPASDE